MRASRNFLNFMESLHFPCKDLYDVIEQVVETRQFFHVVRNFRDGEFYEYYRIDKKVAMAQGCVKCKSMGQAILAMCEGIKTYP